jgi:hypothetical protein
MEWIDKIDGVDTIYAKDINDIAHLSIDASETAKNVAYIGENGNWFIYNATTKKYVDSGKTAEGKNGKSGLPDRRVWNDIGTGSLTIYNNQHNEFAFSDTYTETTGLDYFSLWVDLFRDAYEVDADRTKSSAITVTINIIEGFTFGLYANEAGSSDNAEIVWSGAEPTFTAGYTYFLSFVPISDTRILGAWSEVPTV